MGTIKLVSRECVNSRHTATWLAVSADGNDVCQCGFKCKVRVQIERNGHPPYTYVLTKKEYIRVLRQLEAETKGTT